jgi:hypothetical protein
MNKRMTNNSIWIEDSANFGAQILQNGGKCDDCTCKYGWSGCPKLSMSDEHYASVRYRENQT